MLVADSCLRDSGVPAKTRPGVISEFNEIAQVDMPVSISHARAGFPNASKRFLTKQRTAASPS